MTRPRVFAMVASGVVACVASVVAGVVSCALPPPDEGGACSFSEDCRGDGELECVVIDDDSVCLPVPTDRAPLACTDDDDCSAALFPVEAACVDDVCRCADIPLCDEGEFDVFACACVRNPSGFCATDDDCAAGLNCEAGECARGDEPGDLCSGDEPCEGDLSCICGGGPCTVGTCRREEGGACETGDDCADVIFCVNDRCSGDQGSSGDGCAEDSDCDLFGCEDGICG